MLRLEAPATITLREPNVLIAERSTTIVPAMHDHQIRLSYNPQPEQAAELVAVFQQPPEAQVGVRLDDPI
jgi:hypothetical protein